MTLRGKQKDFNFSCLIEKVNEYRSPELYCILADTFDEMDAGTEQFIKEFPKKKDAIAWSHFYKLKFDIHYREPGGFPISDKKFEEDIKNILDILREVK